jgi:hypothetical protein
MPWRRERLENRAAARPPNGPAVHATSYGAHAFQGLPAGLLVATELLRRLLRGLGPRPRRTLLLFPQPSRCRPSPRAAAASSLPADRTRSQASPPHLASLRAKPRRPPSQFRSRHPPEPSARRPHPLAAGAPPAGSTSTPSKRLNRS